jgi:T4 beta protein
MKFDAKHYVPVLKLKQGEKKALPLLSKTMRARVTPLFEVVERNKDKKDITAHLDTAFAGLGDAVGSHRYFLDCREIESDGPEAAEEAFRRATDLGVSFTPVTGITRLVDVQAALKSRTSGLAIRITRDEFERGIIRNALPTFVATHGLSFEVVDLIVDLGSVDDMIAPGVQTLAAAFLADIPSPTRWHTLTLSASAIPRGGPEARSHDLIDRTDWLSWRDGVRADTSLERIPTFSDSAIQHPRGVEGFDPRVMPLPASIRYTTQEHWLRIKGVDTKDESGTKQFRELATSLVYGHLSEHFSKATHCAGCKGVKCAADGEEGYGQATVWRRLGTVHHTTLTIEQIDALSAP